MNFNKTGQVGLNTPSSFGGSKFQNRNLNNEIKPPSGGVRGDARYSGSMVNRPGVSVFIGKARVAKAVGTAAAPAPVNTPSLKRENKGKDIMSNLLPASSNSAVWGQTQNGSEEKEEDTNSQPISKSSQSTKPAPWAKSNLNSNDSEGPKTATRRSRWGAEDSDEDDDEEEEEQNINQEIYHHSTVEMTGAKTNYENRFNDHPHIRNRGPPEYDRNRNRDGSFAYENSGPNRRNNYDGPRFNNHNSYRPQYDDRKPRSGSFGYSDYDRPRMRTMSGDKGGFSRNDNYADEEELTEEQKVVESARQEYLMMESRKNKPSEKVSSQGEPRDSWAREDDRYHDRKGQRDFDNRDRSYSDNRRQGQYDKTPGRWDPYDEVIPQDRNRGQHYEQRGFRGNSNHDDTRIQQERGNRRDGPGNDTRNVRDDRTNANHRGLQQQILSQAGRSVEPKQDITWERVKLPDRPVENRPRRPSENHDEARPYLNAEKQRDAIADSHSFSQMRVITKSNIRQESSNDWLSSAAGLSRPKANDINPDDDLKNAVPAKELPRQILASDNHDGPKKKAMLFDPKSSQLIDAKGNNISFAPTERTGSKTKPDYDNSETRHSRAEKTFDGENGKWSRVQLLPRSRADDASDRGKDSDRDEHHKPIQNERRNRAESEDFTAEAQRRLELRKEARDRERLSRPPRTRGLLYRFNDEGGIEVVLPQSATNRAGKEENTRKPNEESDSDSDSESDSETADTSKSNNRSSNSQRVGNASKSQPALPNQISLAPPSKPAWSEPKSTLEAVAGGIITNAVSSSSSQEAPDNKAKGSESEKANPSKGNKVPNSAPSSSASHVEVEKPAAPLAASASAPVSAAAAVVSTELKEKVADHTQQTRSDADDSLKSTNVPIVPKESQSAAGSSIPTQLAPQQVSQSTQPQQTQQPQEQQLQQQQPQPQQPQQQQPQQQQQQQQQQLQQQQVQQPIPALQAQQIVYQQVQHMQQIPMHQMSPQQMHPQPIIIDERGNMAYTTMDPYGMNRMAVSINQLGQIVPMNQMGQIQMAPPGMAWATQTPDGRLIPANMVWTADMDPTMQGRIIQQQRGDIMMAGHIPPQQFHQYPPGVHSMAPGFNGMVSSPPHQGMMDPRGQQWAYGYQGPEGVYFAATQAGYMQVEHNQHMIRPAGQPSNYPGYGVVPGSGVPGVEPQQKHHQQMKQMQSPGMGSHPQQHPHQSSPQQSPPLAPQQQAHMQSYPQHGHQYSHRPYEGSPPANNVSSSSSPLNSGHGQRYSHGPAGNLFKQEFKKVTETNNKAMNSSGYRGPPAEGASQDEIDSQMKRLQIAPTLVHNQRRQDHPGSRNQENRRFGSDRGQGRDDRRFGRDGRDSGRGTDRNRADSHRGAATAAGIITTPRSIPEESQSGSVANRDKEEAGERDQIANTSSNMKHGDNDPQSESANASLVNPAAVFVSNPVSNAEVSVETEN